MKKRLLIVYLLLCALVVSGCAANAQPLATPLPDLPLPDAQKTPMPTLEKGGGETGATPSPEETKAASGAIALPEKLQSDE